MPERKVETDFLSTKYFQKELQAFQKKEVIKEGYVSAYNDKVLIGNWQERSRPYRRKIHPMVDNYRAEYTDPNLRANYNDLFDYKIRGWGTNWHTVNDQGLPEQFYNNFSTVYDLTYNKACPKLVKKPPKKQDLTDNYGNTNHYGIKEYMMKKWEDDKKFEIYDIKTTNQETFIAHETPQYCDRRSPYKVISSSFCKITTMHQDFNTRNKKICVCADYPPELQCPQRNPNVILPTL